MFLPTHIPHLDMWPWILMFMCSLLFQNSSRTRRRLDQPRLAVSTSFFINIGNYFGLYILIANFLVNFVRSSCIYFNLGHTLFIYFSPIFRRENKQVKSMVFYSMVLDILSLLRIVETENAVTRMILDNVSFCLLRFTNRMLQEFKLQIV